MADTGERLPDFVGRSYDPIQQRSLVNVLERRLRGISSGVRALERQVQLYTSGGNFAPLNHSHDWTEITTGVPSFLTDITAESITDLSDVSLGTSGYLYWNGSSVGIQSGTGGGGSGIANAYSTFYDASGNSTSSSGADNFRFRSASSGLSTLVIDNDPTYGDHLRLTIVESGIDHDLLANFVADEHIAHSTVTLTAGLGLTGGGDIAASRTFNVGAGEGIAANADDVALSFGTLTPQAITGGSLLAFWDGANHRTITWTDLEDTISITESQISDLGNYGDLSLDEIITGNWRATTSFQIGSDIDRATTPGLLYYSNGSFTTSGDAQASKHVLRVITTDATPTTLTTNGSGVAGTNMLILPNNSAWVFSAYITGRHTTSQDACAFLVEGMIDRAATPGSVVVANYVKETLGLDDNTWDVSVSANTTHGALQIDVTGANAKTIRWVARVDITQVRY